MFLHDDAEAEMIQHFNRVHRSGSLIYGSLPPLQTVDVNGYAEGWTLFYEDVDSPRYTLRMVSVTVEDEDE